MTSQSSSTKGTRMLPLMLNTLKRKWTTMLLIAIIMFFTLPVPLMMIFLQNRDRNTESFPELLRNICEGWSEGIRYALVPILSVLAVVMSCVMLRYLHKKVSVDFYHSLPIKRSKLFAAQLLTGGIALLVPTVIMFAAALIVIAANGGLTMSVLAGSLLSLLEAIIFSLLFYGLASLVGVVTGVTAVHLILTGVAIFIVPLIYVVTVAFCSIFVENMWVDWYFQGDIISKLSPVIRFLADLNTRMTVLEGILYIVFAAGFFFAAYLVYRHYKSERAEISVIFPALGEVIKYSVVFPATLGGGLIFYMTMQNGFWTIFGMVCGGLLTFMLANTILNKSAKAMFRRWKGLIVYAGVCALLMIVAFNNVFGMNTSVPASLTKVNAFFGDNTGEMTFTDKKVMDALRQFNEKGDIYPAGLAWESGQYVEFGDNSYYLSDSMQRLDMKIVYYPTFGFPVAKEIVIVDKPALENELRTILDSDEFRKQYKALAESTTNNLNAIRFVLNNEYYYDDEEYINGEGLRNALVSDLANVGYDYFQSQGLGYATFRMGKPASTGIWFRRSLWVDFPITAKSTNMVKELSGGKTAEELLDETVKNVKSVSVFDAKENTAASFSDPKDVKAILSGLTMLGAHDFGYNGCQLTIAEPRYYVSYTLEGDEDNSYTGMFRLGQVPDCVR